MKSKSIGILTKPKFPEIKATVHAVVNWLRDRKIDVILDNTSATLLNERGGVQGTGTGRRDPEVRCQAAVRINLMRGIRQHRALSG